MNATLEYDQRSLQHEQRMLDLYRQRSSSDGGLLQPLANACWRASAFDWQIKADVRSTRRLWEEAARALAEGFARKRAGFECNHADLLLALHLSIGARSFELVSSLANIVPALTSGVRGRRIPGSPRLLLEGYLLTVRAAIERRNDHARAAQNLLHEARAEADHVWWLEQYPTEGEATWRITEHEAMRSLLGIIARLVLNQPSRRENNHGDDAELDMCMEFLSVMDDVLLALDRFVESEINHRPKLYFWLPGIALSILAERAGLSLEWLEVRHEDKQAGYSRLPLDLVTQ